MNSKQQTNQAICVVNQTTGRLAVSKLFRAAVARLVPCACKHVPVGSSLHAIPVKHACSVAHIHTESGLADPP